MPILPDDDLPTIMQYLRDLLDEISADMRSVQWRLVKLEHQFGALATE